jgi:hypothetical protein
MTECAECRRRLDEIEEWLAEVERSRVAGMPDAARAQAKQLYDDAITAARVVQLNPMAMPSEEIPVHLAADGQPEPPGHEGLQHRATLISDDPELVLRIMHDPTSGDDRLHLIGSDRSMVQHVMIRADDRELEFVTDADGCATVHADLPADLSNINWQVRLPDATFALSPLEQMPPDAPSGDEITLDAGDDNRIGVVLEKDHDGLALRVRLLRINGRDDIERARLVISQEAADERIMESRAHEPCIVSGLSASEPIDIRIFALNR